MYMYSVAMYISSTVCDDRSLLTVHITLIVIGVIVYISGMCVATSLGVVLFKKASSCIGTHRCIMYSTTHELYIVISAQREQHSLQLHVCTLLDANRYIPWMLGSV